ARRLRRMAPPARPAPPEWVRSPRAAIAASVLLALLFGPLLASAADRGQQALRLAHQEVEPLVEGAGAEGHKVLGRLSLAAGTTWDATRESAAKTGRRLQGWLSDLSFRSTHGFESIPVPSTNPDPRRDARGSSRRSR
ncbi:MAG: hypothetical protein WAM82_13355, partial [Thermoanaerobaculia bacterium]